MNPGRRLLILASILLCIVITAQAGEPDTALVSVDIAKLSLDTESYCYFGHGQFLSMRSCHCPWICLEADTCTFNPADSILHLVGSLYDCMQHTDYSKMSFEAISGALVRKYLNEPADSTEMASHPDGWVRQDIEYGSAFVLDVKVTPDSYLAIVQAVPDTTSLVPMMTCEIFKICELLPDK